MKLQRALCLIAGLSAFACSDVGHDGEQADAALVPTDAGAMDGALGDAAAHASPKRNARVVSAAPSYAIAAENYRYEPKTNTKAHGLMLRTAPRGMVLSAGTVAWTPAADQVGKHRVVLSGRDGQGAAVEQEFEIEVATSTLMAEDTVDAESGGTVVAANPRAGRMLGVGVQVPARAVKARVNLTVSQLDRAPSMPNAQGVVRPVRFGPSGTMFDTAARVSLPLPEGVAHAKARLGAYVYNPAGRWERARVLSVDLDNGMMIAEAQHFSIYAASQSGIDVSAVLARAPDASACPGALLAQATIGSPLAEIELASVNNLSVALRERLTETASLRDLLALPEFRGSLRAVQVFELVERLAGGEELTREHRVAITTFHVPGDGSAEVVHADAFGNVLASKRYAEPLRELNEIEQRLRGAASSVRFGDPGDRSFGVAARVHLAYYTGDASLDPVGMDDLGLAAVDLSPTFPSEGAVIADADCDGLSDAFDASDDRLFAAIEAEPSTMSRAFAGEPIVLSARVVRGAPQASSWTVLDGQGASLEPVADAPHARRFRADTPGRYLVSYRAELSERPLEHVFAIDVLAQPLANTAPHCAVVKSVESGRVGEALGLAAIASDAESGASSLRIEWGLVGGTVEQPVLLPASALASSGNRALFSPRDPGNYTVGCRAFDGQAYGAIGALALSVLPEAHNRPPVLSLSPLSTSVQSGQSLTFSAFAKDPDGDALTFSWSVEGARAADPVTELGESRLRVTGEGSEGGVAKATVSVSDGKSPPVVASARILIDPPQGEADADGDGWPAGTGRLADCNDADPRVHPTAKEVCGDRVDYDCDGSVRVDDCDQDGFSVAQGDCDDQNGRRHPRAVELCDGVDNDCNQTVDDGFAVASRCVQGSDECQSFGVIQCAVDGLSSLCTAEPKLPGLELCDRIDNDCDGDIDEDDVCGVAPVDAGVAADAEVRDATAPSGDGGMTTQPTDAGLDHDGGCSNPRPELCDGIDNDCDGQVDEPTSCSTGLPGRCAYGTQRCTPMGPICDVPSYPEICNQTDDDCDGSIDEDLVCACDPGAPENCSNRIDDNCDGMVDGADPQCKQSCAPTSVEYCFDRMDNDCDGLVDGADPDCTGDCQATGPEHCQDGVDNDCDGRPDSEDPDCIAMSPGESCLNPHGIQIGEWNSAYLRGRQDDIDTSCFEEGIDYVFRFDVKDAGVYRVLYEGGAPSAWSIMQGDCSPGALKLEELTCKDGEQAELEPGTYFLVIEGTEQTGSFSVVVEPIIYL